MPYQPKVFANVFSRIRKEGAPTGTLTFVIEYVFMSDPKRSGKYSVDVVVDRPSEERLTDSLKDSLAVYLSSQYSPETFTDRDIVGCGV